MRANPAAGNERKASVCAAPCRVPAAVVARVRHRRWRGRAVGLLLLLGIAGCEYEHDTVAPGYYGIVQNADGAAMDGPAPTAAVGGPSNVQTPVPTPSPAQVAGMKAPPPPGPNTVSPSPSAAQDGGMPSPSPAEAPVAAPMAGPCDMTGRWLNTIHYVTDALGQKQISHAYLYFEISQTGDAFTIDSGHWCADDTVGAGAFAVSIDFSSAWPADVERVSFAGRGGTSTQVVGGCQIELERWYVTRGATIPHYLDPAVALPTVDQRASDTTPGWEDWDGDGNPGITGVISGTINGKVFAAPRVWTEVSGTAADLSSSFVLPMRWDQESNVMSFDGSPLLAGSAARAADPALHFSEFARLSPDQATGDTPAALCQQIAELAPVLTPTGAGM